MSAAVGGILTEEEGYPLDDTRAMVGIILYLAIRAARTDAGSEPIGTLEVHPLVPATVNGRPLFDEMGRAIRWQLTLDG